MGMGELLRAELPRPGIGQRWMRPGHAIQLFVVQGVGLIARPIYSLWNIPPKSEIEVFQMFGYGAAGAGQSILC